REDHFFSKTSLLGPCTVVPVDNPSIHPSYYSRELVEFREKRIVQLTICVPKDGPSIWPSNATCFTTPSKDGLVEGPSSIGGVVNLVVKIPLFSPIHSTIQGTTFHLRTACGVVHGRKFLEFHKELQRVF
ncbi:hypothetical protein HAX54_044783, partial [Datura stramonium]|nr:hypothetical protein [Datura stramonium]